MKIRESTDLQLFVLLHANRIERKPLRYSGMSHIQPFHIGGRNVNSTVRTLRKRKALGFVGPIVYNTRRTIGRLPLGEAVLQESVYAVLHAA